MAINISTVPLNTLTPGVFVEFDSSRAVRGVPVQPHDTLLTGQKTSSGSAVAGQVYAVSSKDEAAALFGRTSQLCQMVAAYKRVDPLTPVYCCALADHASGVAATGSFTWTGPATEAGELVLYIGGHRVVVAVENGDSAAALETKALAALALDLDLPVTCDANSGTGVDLTAVNEGTVGNQIMLGVCLMPGERVPAGIEVTTIPMASGASDPAYSAVVAAMGEDQYHTVAAACQDATNVGALVTEMESRWGAMRAIEGVVFVSKYDTQANLTTYGNSFNSQTLVVLGAEKSATLPLPYETAAMAAGVSALQAQTDPARAMVGASLSGAYAAPRGARFTRAQRNTLLSDGISTLRAASDGRLQVERLVTTYQTNSQGAADTSYQDLYLVRTLAAYRYSVRVRIATKFSNFKLADDGNEVSGQPMVTPGILKAELLAHFRDCQELGWVENFEQFKREILIERDQNDPNRVNGILPPDFINAFMVGAFSIQFRR